MTKNTKKSLLEKKLMKFLIKCVVLGRISDKKQAMGRSLDKQIESIIEIAKRDYGYTDEEIKVFREIYSGKLDSSRPDFEEMLAFCERYKEFIDIVFFLDIDRFTRAGGVEYGLLKRKLKKWGIELVDASGVIQREKNMLKGIGKGFGEDLSYSWSRYSPSESAEIAKAQQAKEEWHRIMLRTMPRLIENIQQGYEAREADFGFRNVKYIDPETGKKRATKEIFPEEAQYIRKMFEMVVAGYDSRTICDEVNKMGFKTRIRKKWSPDRKIIGERGGHELDTKQLWRFIEKVSYAGFKCEAWTWHKLIKAQHPNIIPIDLWNKANEGKFKIVKNSNHDEKDPIFSYDLIDFNKDRVKREYVKQRTEFPYKGLICCHECGKPLKASASTGKSGKRFPLYFCNRKHKQVSVNPTDLKALLKKRLGEMVFKDEIAEIFEEGLREMWLTEIDTVNNDIKHTTDKISKLREKAKELREKIRFLSNPELIKMTDEEYAEVEKEIKILESERAEEVYTEEHIIRIVKYARKFVEHPDKWVLEAHDQATLEGFWSLIFPDFPTLHNLQRRTPDLSPLLKLKPEIEKRQKQCGIARGNRTPVTRMKTWRPNH